jgi:prophage regulatory protein
VAIEYVSANQLAKERDVNPSTIWRWAANEKTGFPKPVKLSDGCTRWIRDEIEQYDAKRAAERTQSAA